VQVEVRGAYMPDAARAHYNAIPRGVTYASGAAGVAADTWMTVSALHDFHNRILAETEISADQPI
jgi:ABC-type arginine transport system permease subunit